MIPLALPADDFPQTRLNNTTGQREVQRDKDGQPLPAFGGKNPSFWLANGEPRLTSHSKSADASEVLKRIEIAERLQRPIGLAVIPSKEVVVIDFDRKNYLTQEALDHDWMCLPDLYPELTQTRIERTPGGGIHIYVKAAHLARQQCAGCPDDEAAAGGLGEADIAGPEPAAPCPLRQAAPGDRRGAACAAAAGSTPPASHC